MKDFVGRAGIRPVRVAPISVENLSSVVERGPASGSGAGGWFHLVHAQLLHGPHNLSALGTYPQIRQRIRARFLDEFVRNALENPHHPYYSIGAKQREEMRRAIIEQLEPSHYLRNSFQQS